MFTGIITACAPIEKILRTPRHATFTIERPSNWRKAIEIGESININGVCSTVEYVDKVSFRVTYVQETLERTTMREKKVREVVNLERSMRLNDLLHGHLVQGHIDGVACLERREGEGKTSLRLTFRHHKNFSHFTTKKGSLAINGVSLTIAEISSDSFTIALIPTTMRRTNLLTLQKGDRVNVEYDCIVKTIAHLYEQDSSS